PGGLRHPGLRPPAHPSHRAQARRLHQRRRGPPHPHDRPPRRPPPPRARGVLTPRPLETPSFGDLNSPKTSIISPTYTKTKTFSFLSPAHASGSAKAASMSSTSSSNASRHPSARDASMTPACGITFLLASFRLMRARLYSLCATSGGGI